jgi:hypothetical protein
MKEMKIKNDNNNLKLEADKNDNVELLKPFKVNFHSEHE